MKRRLAWLYWLGVVLQVVVRMPHERARRQVTISDQRISGAERSVLGLLFVGSGLLPLIYSATRWLDRFNYGWSPKGQARAGAIGSAFLGASLWLFWRSHADLGRNWSPSLEIGTEHRLVHGGVYRSIRHPMYASQWLMTIAQALLLQNWLAGSAGALLFLPLYLIRVPREEQMMLDHFGEAYRRYMRETGRILPRR